MTKETDSIHKRSKGKVARTKFIKIRVTPAELEKFNNLALDRGISLSRLVVSLLEGLK